MLAKNKIAVLRVPALCLVCLCAGVCCFYITSRNVILTIDSYIYALSSQSVLEGEGITIPVVMIDSAMDEVNSICRRNIFSKPPGFPLFLAALGSITPERLWVVRCLNISCHLLICLFCFLIAERLAGTLAGFLAALSAAFTHSILSIHVFFLTEPLFMVFVLFCVWGLLKLRSGQVGSVFFWWSSVCGALAILTRIAGIALLGIFAYEFLRVIVFGKGKEKRAAFVFLVPFFVVAGMFVRNYIGSGSIRGMSVPQTGRGLWESFVGVALMTYNFFFIHKHDSLKFIVAAFLLVPMLIMLFSRKGRDCAVNLVKKGYDILILFMLFYTFVIVWGMSSHLPRFEKRFQVPLVPFVLICAVVLIVCGWSVLYYIGFKKMIRLVTAASMLIFLCGSVVPFYLYRTGILERAAEWRTVKDTKTFDWVTENIKPGTIVVSERAFEMAFWGGYKTVRIPRQYWNPMRPVPTEMKQKIPDAMRQADCEYMALFAQHGEFKPEEYGAFVSELSKRRGHEDLFDISYDCEDGVVYKVKR